MGYRKSYKTNGARIVYGLDGGAQASARIPYGTLTAVDCPDCPSRAGSRCISSTGKTLTQVHISRRRIAMRKYNAELQEEKADG